MQPPKIVKESEIYSDFQDFQTFADHQNLNKKAMFEDQYMAFMSWFKKDIHGRYSKKDFQRIELRNLTVLVAGYAGMLATYVTLHHYYPQHALLWGIPLFLAALYFSKRGDVMHMRTHSPQNLTGVKWIDTAIDYLGLGLSGISPSLFGRRHLAAHYNDIGIISKIFSSINLSFDQVPVSYYLRPQLLLQFLLNEKFLKQERLNRRVLFIETIFFYIYMVCLVGELLSASYFLLVFHLIPGLLLASSQLICGTIVHSSADPRNSFESNALLDYRTAQGLFKVPLWLYSLFNNGFLENHAIHHAYPQVPLELVNQDYRRYHQHILESYQDVRYNRVISMKVHGNLFERLGPPNPFNYVVAFVISIVALLTMTLTVMGLPIAPSIFELALVDYRIYRNSTGVERAQNRIAFMDSLHLEERYHNSKGPNTYLKWVYKWYCGWKRYVASHTAVKPVV
jgi:fatty acid desaturase